MWSGRRLSGLWRRLTASQVRRLRIRRSGQRHWQLGGAAAQRFAAPSHATSGRILPVCAPAVLLPEAKSLRERAAAARKLADALRSALPNVRGEGRRRGAEQVRRSLRASLRLAAMPANYSSQQHVTPEAA